MDASSSCDRQHAITLLRVDPCSLESGFSLQDERTSISGLGDARTFILADLAAAAAAYLMMLDEPEGAAGGEEVNNNLL